MATPLLWYRAVRVQGSNRDPGGSNRLLGGSDMTSRFATHPIALAAACLLMPAQAASVHGARFFGLGYSSGREINAKDVSADGSVIVGNIGDEDAFRWTSGGG